MTIPFAEKILSGHVDRDIVDWLRVGISKWQAGEPLETALRLDPASRTRQRNQWLLEVARLLDDGSGNWQLSKRMADAIRRYQDQVEPLLRRDPFYPVGDIDRAIARVFLAGPPMTSRGRLYGFLNLHKTPEP